MNNLNSAIGTSYKGKCKCLQKSKIKVSREEIKEADLKSCFKCCK